MNILIIARVDHSGAGYALMKAINETTRHRARVISFQRNKLLYPFDILNPNQKQLNEWVQWADVLNLHDEALQYVERTKKPVVTTYHGSWYRSQCEKINNRDKRRGFVSTALTMGLAMLGPKWIGRAIKPLQANQSETFTVIHAPTQRHRKGTHLVLKAFQDLDASLMLIEKKTNAECLKLKSKGHVLIDQVGSKGLGYGTNALEAWAMGFPVISNAPARVIAKMISEFGYCPFLVANTVDQIKHAVTKLQDKDFYTQWSIAGYDFVNTYHSQEYVAKQFLDVCRKAMS